jgi:hypothetical protein
MARHRAAARSAEQAAVRLLPLVAWHGLNRTARQEQLSQWTGLASAGAACAIRANQITEAVLLLEQGRSMLWNQALSMRSDLSRLADAEPALARQLDRVRTVLDRPVSESVPMNPQMTASIPSERDLQPQTSGSRGS